MEGSGQLQDPVALPGDKNPEYLLNRRMQEEGNTTVCMDAVRTTVRRAELRAGFEIRTTRKQVGLIHILKHIENSTPCWLLFILW